MYWEPPPEGVFKLNVDGLVWSEMAVCGGLIQDYHGQFVRGFHCNLGAATAASAELWGLMHGLRLAKSLVISQTFWWRWIQRLF